MRWRRACNWLDRFRLPLDCDIQGFRRRLHCPYPAGLFNFRPQSGRLRRHLTVPMHSFGIVYCSCYTSLVTAGFLSSFKSPRSLAVGSVTALFYWLLSRTLTGLSSPLMATVREASSAVNFTSVCDR